MDTAEAIANIERFAPKPNRLPTIEELEAACKAIAEIEEMFGDNNELSNQQTTI